MHAPIHVDGIRVAHIHEERDVRVNRMEAGQVGIAWSRVGRVDGLKVREGKGESGLVYRLVHQVPGGTWRVTVHAGRGQAIEVGSARMQDHAAALAGMWEQGVSSGRIDVG